MIEQNPNRVRDLEEMLRWVAQTVHQAYHHGPYSGGDLDRITWRECPKDICASIRDLLGGHR